MIVSHELKYVYIAVPKTGSSAMNTLLTSHFAGEQLGPHHLTVIPQECKDYFVFTGVRNPYCRIKSLWKHARRFVNHRLHCVATDKTFFQFCLWQADLTIPPQLSFQEIEKTYWDTEAKSEEFKGREPNQTDFLRYVEPDLVIRLESAQEDFERLPFAAYSNAKLGYVNVDPDGATVSIEEEMLANPDIARAIYAWAWRDLYRYGYEKFDC